MSNEEILEKLYESDCYDADKCIEDLKQFDKTKSDFPNDKLIDYVRFDRWNYSDFNFENEMFIKDFFPQYVLDIFFAVKEFKKNSRTELLDDQETFAKLYNMPYKSQEEKANVVYHFVFNRYFENSNLNLKGEN